MRILDSQERVIPHPSGAASLNSEVRWALNLRAAWKNEIVRMVSIFRNTSTYEAPTARAHSLTFYAPARLNRYPRITDAGGLSPRAGSAGSDVTLDKRISRYLSHASLRFYIVASALL